VDGKREVLERSRTMRARTMRMMVVPSTGTAPVQWLELDLLRVLVAAGLGDRCDQVGVPIRVASLLEGDPERRLERAVVLVFGLQRVQLRVQHGRDDETERGERGEKRGDALATG
jgi:hypothetical protein